ncbi:MAG: hypothetical protein LBP26_06060 [Clostridiales bacterium]|jgi:ABC-type glycerol-3-phosphate transport system substrate-binding protein|nr:hypothetical protein [Clostridiales bacterium]
MFKGWKKGIVAALAAVFALTGCFGGGNNDDGDGEDAEHLTISFFGIDYDDLQSPTESTEKIMKVIEDKFDVEFEVLNGSSAGWKQVLGQYIGGGDVPDVFFHTREEPLYSDMLSDGLLFNYSEYLDEYPNLKKAFSRYPEKEMKHLLGGDYYGYPIVMNDETDSALVNEHAMYYRRDWYTNLVAKNWAPTSGRPLVDPENENFNYLNFYDLCEGFTKGDPDGNSKNDTYGYAMTKDGGLYWWYPLLTMFGVSADGWYKDGDGKWQPEVISDKAKEAVMFISDMYDNGFINSTYATITTQPVMKNEFQVGKAGMVTYNATYPMGLGILDNMRTFVPGGKSLSDVVRAMPTVTGKDGTKRTYAFPNLYGYRAINNDISVNKKKRIMSIMDYMLSEEGMRLLDYGIEGEHYKIEDGKIVSLLGTDPDGGGVKTLYHNSVAPGVFRLKSLVSWTTRIDPGIRFYNEQMQLLDAWGKSQHQTVPNLYYVSVDKSYGLKMSQLEELAATKYKEIVKDLGDGAAAKREAAWNSLVSKYKKDGDQYIRAKNAGAQELYGE